MKDLSLAVEKEKLALPAWLRWALATTLGYSVGLTLSAYLVSSFLRPAGPLLGGMFNIFVYGALIGIALGVCQFIAMLPRLVPFSAWILATALGSALGLSVASVISEALSNAQDPARQVVLGYGIVAIIAGGIIGGANGLGQWLVLRRFLPDLHGWILSGTLGTLLGSVMATALLGLFGENLPGAPPSTTVGAILGITLGIVQGLVFRS